MTDTGTKTAESGESQQERLTDLRHSDELSSIRQNAWALCAAVAGLREFNVTEDAHSGVLKLAYDLCDEIADCAAAFDSERLLRMTPEERAFIEEAAHRMAQRLP